MSLLLLFLLTSTAATDNPIPSCDDTLLLSTPTFIFSSSSSDKLLFAACDKIRIAACSLDPFLSSSCRIKRDRPLSLFVEVGGVKTEDEEAERVVKSEEDKVDDDDGSPSPPPPPLLVFLPFFAIGSCFCVADGINREDASLGAPAPNTECSSFSVPRSNESPSTQTSARIFDCNAETSRDPSSPRGGSEEEEEEEGDLVLLIEAEVEISRSMLKTCSVLSIISGISRSPSFLFTIIHAA